jgi:hypothetical protein
MKFFFDELPDSLRALLLSTGPGPAGQRFLRAVDANRHAVDVVDIDAFSASPHSAGDPLPGTHRAEDPSK